MSEQSKDSKRAALNKDQSAEEGQGAQELRPALIGDDGEHLKCPECRGLVCLVHFQSIMRAAVAEGSGIHGASGLQTVRDSSAQLYCPTCDVKLAPPPGYKVPNFVMPVKVYDRREAQVVDGQLICPHCQEIGLRLIKNKWACWNIELEDDTLTAADESISDLPERQADMRLWCRNCDTCSDIPQDLEIEYSEEEDDTEPASGKPEENPDSGGDAA